MKCGRQSHAAGTLPNPAALFIWAAPGVRRNAENRSARMGIFRNLQPYSLVPRLESGGMRKTVPPGWNSPESRASIHRYHEAYPLTHFIGKKPCRGRALPRPALRKRHASGKRPRPAGTLPNLVPPFTGITRHTRSRTSSGRSPVGGGLCPAPFFGSAAHPGNSPTRQKFSESCSPIHRCRASGGPSQFSPSVGQAK